MRTGPAPEWVRRNVSTAPHPDEMLLPMLVLVLTLASPLAVPPAVAVALILGALGWVVRRARHHGPGAGPISGTR